MRGFLTAGLLALALSGCGIFSGGGDKKPKTPTVGERLAVLTYEAAIEADPELASQAIVLPPPVANVSWAQPGGSADRAMGHLMLGERVAKAWSVSIGSGSDKVRRLLSGPVVADGRVYTIDTQAAVRAFDARTGRLLWSNKISRPGEKDRIAFGGGVSIGAGRVYATSGYGLVVAYDGASGAQLWRADLKVPLRGAPSFDDDRLFVMSQDNQLIVLNAAKGETLWDAVDTVEATSLMGAAPPAVFAGTAIVGYSSGDLMAMRVENGRVVWQDTLARTGRTAAIAALTDIDAPAVIDSNRVYAIGHGGRLVALELATGQRLWERSLAGVSKPWVAGDYVYVVTIDGELVALTRAEGKVRWVTQLQRWRKEKKRKDPIRWSGPVLASDRLVLTNSLGQMVSVSPYTGQLMSSVKLGEAAYIGPVVADSSLYVLTDDGKLSAYR